MARLAIRPRREEGQSLVEVALVAPLFFALLFGAIDIGRVIWANDAVANAAREGARYASVHAGTPGLTVKATPDEIRTQALNFVIAGGTGTTVTVCFSAVHVASQTQGCTGDVDEAGAAYARGNMVTVTVTSHVPMIVGLVVGLHDFTVTGTSSVIINN
jgi:Flp pilus assembly protein TadG